MIPAASKRQIGGAQEEKALGHFLSLGWRLLDRNWSCRSGELDLILQDPRGCVVFVEVRYRTRTDFGRAQETVGFAKQRRIAKAALLYIKQKGLERRDLRFDVAAVTPDGIEHIPNAFSASGYFL